MDLKFFWEQMHAWSAPPVDDVGYIPSAELLNVTDDALRILVTNMSAARYNGWRNHAGRWRDLMGLDELAGKDVLDYGCGTGVEALQLAMRGNRVTVTDIWPANVTLATRVLSLYGYSARACVIDPTPPFVPYAPASFDVVYMSGVLHHIPEPEPVMERASELLRPGGEARVMVYSDAGWRIATGTDPPADVSDHPQRAQFTRFFDEVGDWADWYSHERLQERFGEWFTVDRFSYLTPDDRYCAAVLRRR